MSKRLDPLVAEAAENQQVDTALALVLGGADPDSRDSWGKTPLYYASKYGLLGLAQFLVHSGA